MADKNSPTNFIVYRYLLSKADKIQTQLFEDIKSPDDAHAKRQELMCAALDAIPERTAKSKMRFWKEVSGEKGQYLFHLQKISAKTVEQDFKYKSVPHEPSAWIAIDTDPFGQTIAVEDTSQLRHHSIINHLCTLLQPYFQERGLDLFINPISRQHKFWEYVNENREQIKEVIFKFSPPNMAGVNKSVAKGMSDLAGRLQARSAVVTLASRANNPLTLEESDEELSAMVESAEAGTSRYAFKVKNSRKLHKPEQIEQDLVAVPKGELTLIERAPDEGHTPILKKLKHFFRRNPS